MKNNNSIKMLWVVSVALGFSYLIVPERAHATEANFGAEYQCYSALINKTKTLGNGSDLIYDSSGKFFRILRKADSRSPFGYFLYGPNSVTFIKIDVDKLKEYKPGQTVLRLDYPGLSEPLFAIISAPSQTSAENYLGNPMELKYQADKEVRNHANQLTYIDDADASLARKVILNNIEDGVKTVHDLYVSFQQQSTQSGDVIPKEKAEKWVSALKTCTSVNDDELSAAIKEEIGKFQASSL